MTSKLMQSVRDQDLSSRRSYRSTPRAYHGSGLVTTYCVLVFRELPQELMGPGSDGWRAQSIGNFEKNPDRRDERLAEVSRGLYRGGMELV